MEILMSISPGVRQELFKPLAKKKVPVQTAPNCKVTIVEEVDEEVPPIKIKKSELKSEKIALEDLNIRATFMCMTEDNGTILKGSILSSIYKAWMPQKLLKKFMYLRSLMP